MLVQTFTVASLLSLSFAAPTFLEKRLSPLPMLRPTVISRYTGSNGAIVYNVPTGTAAKTYQGDVTTLVTFSNPSLDLPTTCRIRFNLDSSDTAVVTEGTKQVNIYTSLYPAPAAGSAGWGGPGNGRNQDVGRFLVYKGGNADLIMGTDSVACPKKGETVGFEVVPTGDADRVEWSKDLSGLYLTWI